MNEIEKARERQEIEEAEERRHLARLTATLMAPFMDRTSSQVPEDRERHIHEKAELCLRAAKYIIERTRQ